MRLSRVLLLSLISTMLIASCADKPSEPVNLPPESPSNPSPADGESRIELDVTLSWDCTDPDGDDLVFDLYFSTDSIMSILDSNLIDRSYAVGSLDYDTPYFWRVVAEDEFGAFSYNDIWNFRTRRPSGIYELGGIRLNGERILACRIFVSEGNLYYVDGQNGGLHIIRVSDPSNPVYVAVFDPDTRINDVFLEGNFAYITCQDSSFRILDISDPASPRTISEILFSYYAVAVACRGDYAYVTADAFKIIDISDRANPMVIGEWPGYWPWYPIRFSGNYACLLHGGWETSFLDIVDISDPTSPAVVGSCFAGGTAWSLAVNDGYVHVADHWFGGINVFDISDPSNPVYILEYGEASSGDIFILDQLAYCAGWGGLRIYDISDPMNPRFEASYGYDIEFEVVAVFVDDRYIYIVDRIPRLWILEYEP